jgi:uncharacterized protein
MMRFARFTVSGHKDAVTRKFEPAELSSLTQSIFEALVDDPNAFGLGPHINEFYASIQRWRPIQALGQKCVMDSAEAIAVNLTAKIHEALVLARKGLFGSVPISSSHCGSPP